MDVSIFWGVGALMDGAVMIFWVCFCIITQNEAIPCSITQERTKQVSIHFLYDVSSNAYFLHGRSSHAAVLNGCLRMFVLSCKCSEWRKANQCNWILKNNCWSPSCERVLFSLFWCLFCALTKELFSLTFWDREVALSDFRQCFR